MTTHSHQAGIAAIAVFKVVKGVLLLLVGLGLLKLMHAEIATLFSLLIEALHLNAESRIIHALVLKVNALQPHRVPVAGVVSLAEEGMSLLERLGLDELCGALATRDFRSSLRTLGEERFL